MMGSSTHSHKDGLVFYVWLWKYLQDKLFCDKSKVKTVFMVYKDLYKKMEEICLRSNYFREDTDYTTEGPFQGWTLVGREAVTVHLLYLGEVGGGITWTVLVIQKRWKF